MFSNPVYEGYFADPFVWQHAGRYYAVGTGLVVGGEAQANRVIPLLTSVDLRTWEPLGGALVRLDSTFGDHYWAPEVAFANGTFWLYYSVGGENDAGHHLRVARSDQPQGPYHDCGIRLTDAERGIPFAIDPSPFQDTDGQWYLFYARDFLDTNDGAHAGTALAVDRLTEMTRLAGEERTLLRARHDWTLFEGNRLMYGSRWDWHTLEGPQVRLRNRRYWLLFSGGRWTNESYGVDWAGSDAVMGPYTGEASDKPRLLRTGQNGGLIGPGHNCVVTAPDGTDCIVFHAWNHDHSRRQMYILPLAWTAQGPQIVSG